MTNCCPSGIRGRPSSTSFCLIAVGTVVPPEAFGDFERIFFARRAFGFVFDLQRECWAGLFGFSICRADLSPSRVSCCGSSLLWIGAVPR
jgi:hypothetical protein